MQRGSAGTTGMTRTARRARHARQARQGGLRHQGMALQVRPGNEGPRARYPRPDALSTTLGLTLREHGIRTGDAPGQDSRNHLASPPPETWGKVD